MAQIWIEIEDNDNCGYYPTQTFETRADPESGTLVEVVELPGSDGPQQIIGWCSENGGSPCDVAVVLIGDSGAGESRLIKGGDYGVRIRPAELEEPWSLDARSQRGEPYLLLASDADYRLKPRQ